MKDYKYYDELEALLKTYNEDINSYDLAKSDELPLLSLVPYVVDQVQDEEEAEDVIMLLNNTLSTFTKIPFKLLDRKYRIDEYIKSNRFFDILINSMDQLCTLYPNCFIPFFEIMTDYVYLAFENDLYYYGSSIFHEFVCYVSDKFDAEHYISLNCSTKKGAEIFNRCFDILENAAMFAIEQAPLVEKKHHEEEVRRHERFGWVDKYDDIIDYYYIKGIDIALESLSNYCFSILERGFFKIAEKNDTRYKLYLEKKNEFFKDIE